MMSASNFAILVQELANKVHAYGKNVDFVLVVNHAGTTRGKLISNYDRKEEVLTALRVVSERLARPDAVVEYSTVSEANRKLREGLS